MTIDPYVHLHNHTEYSMLDGYQQHEELAAHVAELGQPAVAMTDHGNMFGAYSFYHAMNKAGVKPIIGVEAYVAPGSRLARTQEFWNPTGKRPKKDRTDDEGQAKDVAGGGRFTHLTLLAQDAVGLRMLYELTGRASIDGQYPRTKNRMDRDLFEEVIGRHGQHIIASTGCPSSEVQTRLHLGQYDEAKKAAAYYQQLFGPERYFLEVMDHGLDLEKRVRDQLLQLGRELNIPPLATNDAHYVHQGQAHAHDCLLAIGTGDYLSAPDRMKFEGDGYYVKSAAQMRALFDDAVPGACDNTLLVAEMVGSYEEVFAFSDRMPHPPIPDGYTEESFLRHLVDEGLQKRYGAVVPAEARERADWELGIILPLGFAGYFIMVHLLCIFMRENGIRFGPRGSAAGSIVVYALEIADMDPIRHKLMFERFMNPERISPPDIDLDIDERRREEVIKYVVATYGEDHVSQIITFGRMKTRESITDAARIKELPIAAGKRLKATVPADQAGFGVTFDEIFDEKHERYDEGQGFRDLLKADSEAEQIFTTAKLVETRIRKTGKHACGVIVSSSPLLGQIPVWLDLPKPDAEKKGARATLLAGHEYPDLEKMGLQKMDLLGLRNWTVVDDTIKMIERNHGLLVDIDALSGFDDPDVYAMLGRGETAGVFQLEGSGMQALLRRMRPTEFEDIMAVGALYRPGPMGMDSHNIYADRKNGRVPTTPIHPDLEDALREILAPAYGVICFQEQVIDAVMIVAGYTRGRADLVRKIMGKKKLDLLEKERIPFAEAAAANGYSPEAVQALWDTLVPFAKYAFNRAHTCCYGRLAYVTAWLKCHYPAEYLAALLTSVSAKDKDKAALYLAECRRLGVTVLPPDVNQSRPEMSVVDGAIRYGLAAIRDVGDGVVEAVLRGRADRPYESFFDFLQRVPGAGCTKKAVAGLIEAGAFDTFGTPRRALLAISDQAVEASAGDKKKEAQGAFTLFADLDDSPGSLELSGVVIPDLKEWDKQEKLAKERARLGLYVSGHPLDGTGEVLAAYRTTTLLEVQEREVHEGDAHVSGIITGLQVRMAKTGMMATFDLEDIDTTLRCVVFPRTYQIIGTELANDRIVSLKGRLSDYEGAANLMVDKILVLNLVDGEIPVVLSILQHQINEEMVAALKRTLQRYPGDRPVRIEVEKIDGRRDQYALPGFAVLPGVEFRSEIRELLGRGSVSA